MALGGQWMWVKRSPSACSMFVGQAFTIAVKWLIGTCVSWDIEVLLNITNQLVKLGGLRKHWLDERCQFTFLRTNMVQNPKHPAIIHVWRHWDEKNTGLICCFIVFLLICSGLEHLIAKAMRCLRTLLHLFSSLGLGPAWTAILNQGVEVPFLSFLTTLSLTMFWLNAE